MSDADEFENCFECNHCPCLPQCEKQETPMTRPELHAWAVQGHVELIRAEQMANTLRMKQLMTTEEKKAASREILDRGMAMVATTRIRIALDILRQARNTTSRHIPHDVAVRWRLAVENLEDIKEVFDLVEGRKPAT
jgi:hypothetical protein